MVELRDDKIWFGGNKKFEFLIDVFKSAVADSKSMNNLLEILKLTKSQSNKDKIDAGITLLGLNTSHWIYTLTEQGKKGRANTRRTELKTSSVNEKYSQEFEKFFGENWDKYKSAIWDILETIGEKDFATVSVNEIQDFLDKGENRTNRCNFIRSLMRFIIEYNISNAKEKVASMGVDGIEYMGFAYDESFNQKNCIWNRYMQMK